MHRLDEDGPTAIVRMQVPVNRFPDFVDHIVQRLKVICPALGKKKLAQVLARAGLHLSAGTVGRMLRDSPPQKPRPVTSKRNVGPAIPARYPHHVWHCDLTLVPTGCGLWASWLPFALPQRWPFCWWVAVAVDHYSRRCLGCAVFDHEPTAVAVRGFLDRLRRRLGAAPRYLITDKGVQFREKGFRNWARRRGIRQRFSAVGKYGGIAVIERFIRTMKDEGTRRVLVSYAKRSLERELRVFAEWFNEHRPHDRFGGGTPDEMYRGVASACTAPRFEPRAGWPRVSPCAAPRASVRGRCGVTLDLHVSYLAGRKHLPIVTLQKAA